MSIQSSPLTKAKLAVKAKLGRAKKAALKRLLGGNPFGVVIQSDNGLFTVDVEDTTVARRLMQGGYGADELKRLYAKVNAKSRMLVVGGHIGTIAVPVSGKVAHVDVIEANPANFALLQANVRLNGRTNIALHPIAASSDKKPLTFLMSRANSGGSKRMPKHGDFMYTYDAPETITVPATRLDDLFAKAQPFDVIFMDIEGSEYFALKGMPAILGKAKHLFIEFVPHHLANVAGIGVTEFLEVLAPAKFTSLHIPSKNKTVKAADFARVLGDMFKRGEDDDGLVFSK